MCEETSKGNLPIQPFCLLAKTLQGAALSKLIQQVTELPGIFKFGELLQLTNVQELQNNQTFARDWALLNLFAFGTFLDYLSNKASLPELNETQIFKLKLLTIATLASKSKYVSYDELKEKLHLSSIRVIEDLIIEAVYVSIIQGKLNQKDQRFEVDFVIGRDIQSEKIDYVVGILDSWCEGCNRAVTVLENLVHHANTTKEVQILKQKTIEDEVEKVKNMLKAQDQSLEVQSTTTQPSVNQKEKSKGDVHRPDFMGLSNKIPIPNGTLYIDVRCARLTYLVHDNDGGFYICEFSDWSYGVFAVCVAVSILLPILVVIYCCMKWCHRDPTKRYDRISQQTSASTLYTEHRHEQLNDVLDEGVSHHKPLHRNGKLYFPYPAYGTFDGDSLQNSTNSFTFSGSDAMLQQPINRRNAPLSNSAPSLTSVLNSVNKSDSNKSTSSSSGVKDTLCSQSPGSLTEGPSVGEEPRDCEKTNHECVLEVETVNDDNEGVCEDDNNTPLENEMLKDCDLSVNLNSDPSTVSASKENLNSSDVEVTERNTKDKEKLLLEYVGGLAEVKRNGTFVVNKKQVGDTVKTFLTIFCHLDGTSNTDLYDFEVLGTPKDGFTIRDTSVEFSSTGKLIDHYRVHHSPFPCPLGNEIPEKI